LLFFDRFYCQGRTLLAYTLTTLAAAIAGSIAPFQPVFNEPKNKVGPTLSIINVTHIAHEVYVSDSVLVQNLRIAFFLAICLTASAPLTHLAIQHGLWTMIKFAGKSPLASGALVAPVRVRFAS
jgi:hypothetical protein